MWSFINIVVVTSPRNAATVTAGTGEFPFSKLITANFVY